MNAEREYRVLVVDDEEPIRRLAARALVQEGLRCDTAEDGAQARQLLAVRKYDAVIADLHMPQHNGHTLTVELLAGAHPPAIVIVTGIAEPRLARDLLARGVDDVLFKPVDYRLLAIKVRAILKRRRAGECSNVLEHPSTAPPVAISPPEQELSESAPRASVE